MKNRITVTRELDFKHNIQGMIDRDMKMLSKPIEFFHDYPPDEIFVKHNWGARVDCGLGTNQNLKQRKGVAKWTEI